MSPTDAASGAFDSICSVDLRACLLMITCISIIYTTTLPALALCLLPLHRLLLSFCDAAASRKAKSSADHDERQRPLMRLLSQLVQLQVPLKRAQVGPVIFRSALFFVVVLAWLLFVRLCHLLALCCVFYCPSCSRPVQRYCCSVGRAIPLLACVFRHRSQCSCDTR
jgi:hypothetical protein